LIGRRLRLPAEEPALDPALQPRGGGLEILALAAFVKERGIGQRRHRQPMAALLAAPDRLRPHVPAHVRRGTDQREVAARGGGGAACRGVGRFGQGGGRHLHSGALAEGARLIGKTGIGLPRRCGMKIR
jgi:hypothetical protein